MFLNRLESLVTDAWEVVPVREAAAASKVKGSSSAGAIEAVETTATLIRRAHVSSAGSIDSLSALPWLKDAQKDAQKVGKFAWGVVDWHNGAAVTDLVGARVGEHVRED